MNGWSNSCRGKVQYSSRSRANAAIRVLRKADNVIDADTLMAYRCREDKSHWHVGHRVRPVLPPPLRRVKAAAGDVVEITWRMPDGTEHVERHTVGEQVKAKSCA